MLGREQLTTIAELNIDKVDLHLLLRLDTDHQWRTLASCDNLTWVTHTLHEQTEGTLELLDHGLAEGREVNVWVLVVDVLCELGNGLCVRFRLELHALAFKQDLQLLIVCDDAIVHNSKLPLGV